MIVKILVGIIVIVLIPFVMALFISKEYAIEREVMIRKPKAEVFNYIKIISNQKNYNKWWMDNPNAQQTFTGTDGTPGFVTTWDSHDKKGGAGAQEIKTVKEGERLDCQIRFIRPFEGISNTSMITTAISDQQTKVKWIFGGRYKYPMNFMNLFTEKILGKDLQASLDNLKGVLER